MIYAWPETIIPVSATCIVMSYMTLRWFNLKPWFSVLIPVCILTFFLDVLAVRALFLVIEEIGYGCATGLGFALNRMDFAARLLILPVGITVLATHRCRPDLSKTARILTALPWIIGIALIAAPALIRKIY